MNGVIVMRSYTITSGLSPSEVVKRAQAFFGHGGLDLDISVSSDLCVRFAGRGYVQVSVREGSNETIVQLDTRLCDEQVRQFMATLMRTAAKVDEGG
jgi:hypothetical protein